MASMKDALRAALAKASEEAAAKASAADGGVAPEVSPSPDQPPADDSVVDMAVRISRATAPTERTVLARTTKGDYRPVQVSYGHSKAPPSVPRHRAARGNGVVLPPMQSPMSSAVPSRSANAGTGVPPAQVVRMPSLYPQPAQAQAPAPAPAPARPVATIGASARCLVSHYPDAPRVPAHHEPGMGEGPQLAGPDASDVHDLTIGLDFGTSTVKVVVTDASLEQSFAVPLCDSDAFAAYLLPSRVFAYEGERGRSPDRVDYSLTECGTAHRDLKLGLLAHPDSLEHQEPVVAFLALVMRSVRAWLFEQHASVYQHARIAWRVAIGLPSASVLDNAAVPLLERLVCAAWKVAGQRGAVTRHRVRTALRMAPTPESLDLEVAVLPEIAAQIYGFVVSQSFDRKAANRFVMVDVGAGTIDSALFRVLPPTRGRWSFEFYTAVVQPLGVANLHAQRVDWWAAELSRTPKGKRLREALLATKFATDMEHAPPNTYRGYFSGVSLDHIPGLKSPDDEFFTKVMAQVRGQTMWRAWKESLLPQCDLTGIPIFVCGGGSRMPFYAKVNDAIGHMPGCTWLSAEPWVLGFPGDLWCECSDDAEFDRLSVAYGLSLLNLGNVVQAPPQPKFEVPQQPWADRYIDKDSC